MEKVLALLLCCIPTGLHVYYKKTNDLLAVIGTAFLLGLLPGFILPAVSALEPVPLVKTMPLSLGIYALLFDYWITYEGVVDSPPALLRLWLRLGTWGRLTARLVVFLASLVWFLL